MFKINNKDTRKVVAPFFVIGSFCTPHSICFKLASDRTGFMGMLRFQYIFEL